MKNKFYVVLFLLLLFVLPVGAIQYCFDRVGTTFTLPSSTPPVFAIGADGKFYVADATDGTMYSSVDGSSWPSSPIGMPGGGSINSFEAHPANSNVLFAGADQYYAKSTNGGSSWSYFGAGAADRRFIATSRDASYIYVLNSNGSLQGVQYDGTVSDFITLPPLQLGESGYNLMSVAGATPVVARENGSVYYFQAGGLYPFSATFSGASVLTVPFSPSGDVYAYIGTSSGVVSRYKLTSGPSEQIATLDLPVRSIVNHSGKVVMVASHASDVNVNNTVAVYNGSGVAFLSPVLSTGSKFLPMKAATTKDGARTYVLGKDKDGNLAVYRLNDVCTRPNNPPLLTVSEAQTVVVNTTVQFSASTSDPDGDTVTLTGSFVSGPGENSPEVEATVQISADGRTISFRPPFNGTYIFTYVAKDNGYPELNATRNVTITVTAAPLQNVSNATQANVTNATNATRPPSNAACTVDEDCAAGEFCTSGVCVPVPPGARCSSSEACADNEECVSDVCGELSCASGEVAVDHQCLPLSQVTICGGSPHAGAGVCCNNQWLAGESQCPAGTNTTTQNRTIPPTSGPSPGDVFSGIASQIAGIGLLIVGIGVLGLLVIAGLVYWFVLRKKPPSEPLEGEETTEGGST